MELGLSYYNNNESSVCALNPNPYDSDIPILQSYDPERGTRRRMEGPAIINTNNGTRRAAPSATPQLLYSLTPVCTRHVRALHRSARQRYTPRMQLQSQDAEDEWTNARTPKTARPPDPAPAPGAYTPRASSPDPVSSFPPSPQSPRSARRRTRSPGLHGGVVLEVPPGAPYRESGSSSSSAASGPVLVGASATTRVLPTSELPVNEHRSFRRSEHIVLYGERGSLFNCDEDYRYTNICSIDAILTR
ncbi:hypothetical protein EDB83DRAFT_435658 [Lactarius deliciosus]|nr:hypothetical protein EDB83DRAFT_435658 [Lactarius deliciosus]